MKPIDYLRAGAQAVAMGKLDVHVPLVRADEFGTLIGEFNHMVAELREKERLRRAFGLHVGRGAAEQILARDPGLGGVEEGITGMFVDIRSFTAMSAAADPREVVETLNRFFRVMVQIVEEKHDGMVNKFLGDGFLALFGVGRPSIPHADSALAAGRDMLCSLTQLNKDLAFSGERELAIGIGIHTGRAIVGSIGSPERLEYTAIGTTVNFASRIEPLTKLLGTPLLFTESTKLQLRSDLLLHEFPAQWVRGLDKPIKVFSVADLQESSISIEKARGARQ
jgi:adenylate cyclase